MLALAASPALAQFRPGDDDPEIVAARQAVYDAPYDNRSGYSARLLELIAARFGEESKEYAQELQLHGDNLLAEKPLEAVQAHRRAVALNLKLFTADSSEVAFARNSLAKALAFNGFREEALEPYGQFVEKVVDIAYGCGKVEDGWARGCSHNLPLITGYMFGYAMVFHDLGRTDEGVAVYEDVLTKFEPRWAACATDQWAFECDEVADERRKLASSYADFLDQVGRAMLATSIRKRTTLSLLAEAKSCEGEDCDGDYDLMSAYRDYREGLYELESDEAFDFDAEWLSILVDQPIYRRGGANDAGYSDRTYRESVDEILADFAERASRASRAEFGREVLAQFDKADLIEAEQAESIHAVRVALLKTQIDDLAWGEYGARAKLEEQLGAEMASQFGADSYEYGVAIRDAARTYARSETPEAALPLMQKALSAFIEARGVSSFPVWATLHEISQKSRKLGREAAALETLRNVLGRPENDHLAIYTDPVAARQLNNGLFNEDEDLNRSWAELADILLERGEGGAEALAAARHAALGMRAWRQSLSFSRHDEGQLATALSGFWNLDDDRRYAGFFTLFADALWDGSADRAVAHPEAFLALQEATMGATSQAVAKAAAERALQAGGVEELLEKRNAIDAEIDALSAQSMRPTAQVKQGIDPSIVSGQVTSQAEAVAIRDSEYQRQQRDFFAQIQRKQFERERINQQIMAAAPGYFELIRPQALSIDDARALVGQDEAFLLVVPTDYGTHSLLVSDAGISWHRSDLAGEQLNGHVRRLLWDVGASIEVSYGERITWEGEGEGEFPFDRGTAHLLYRELVAPHADALAGKRHLFVAASDSLSSLPFSIFVTEEPTGADGDPEVLRNTPWLGDTHAIVQLPSLQSLELLRAVEDAQGNTSDMLLGFGDPVLTGEAVERGTSVNQRLTRASGLPIRQGFTAFSGGDKRLANPESLRGLARLPGTRIELEAMAEVFGARNASIFLAEDATEAEFYRTDLASASVISFATHGLIAGEVDGVVEPGLVFTPPTEATSENDGLLAASEVTGLTLNADWVILSACNTASGDGSDGAPGLSGLSRSFFFAGARSLLASHWPVKDDVAAIMTVRILELQKANPKLSRAEALQAAMREVREDTRGDGKSTWAHPSAWAPFAYIGDIR